MADLPGAAVPGLGTPGALDPGLPGSFSAPVVSTWQFTGTEQLFYLQYLGPDGRTLNPVPGQQYTAGTITIASGQEAGLADPPADGRWITF